MAAIPLAAKWLPLEAACGCLLVDDLVALTDLPVADTSAMDGWAVAGSPPWRVVADLPAGRLLEHPLSNGQCARIATGAVIPDGADAVLKVEESVLDAAGVQPSNPARIRGLAPTFGARAKKRDVATCCCLLELS